MMAECLQELFKTIEVNQDLFVESLRKWVAIPSVSAVADGRNDCFKMVDFVAKELRDLGANVEICNNPLGKQNFGNGVVMDYPPIILGVFFYI